MSRILTVGGAGFLALAGANLLTIRYGDEGRIVDDVRLDRLQPVEPAEPEQPKKPRIDPTLSRQQRRLYEREQGKRGRR